MGPCGTPHHHASAAIQATIRLVSTDGFESGPQVIDADLYKSTSRIERHAPRHLTKGRQGPQLPMPDAREPGKSFVQQRRAEAAVSVVRRHVEFLEVRSPIGQHHNVGEADGRLAKERDPEPFFLVSRGELAPRCGLFEDGGRRVPEQQGGRLEFDAGERAQVLRRRRKRVSWRADVISRAKRRQRRQRGCASPSFRDVGPTPRAPRRSCPVHSASRPAARRLADLG